MTDTKEILSYVVIIIIGIILAQHLNVVVSGSMEPVFARGDVVVIQKASFLGLSEMNTSQLNVGDIVIYSKYGGTEVKIDNEELVILHESDLIAKRVK